jgi:Glycine rich protein
MGAQTRKGVQMANRIRTAGTTWTLALLAACGGTTGSLPPGNPAATASSLASAGQPAGEAGASTGPDGTLTVRIRVPKAAAGGARYVSPATQGMTIAFNGRTKVEKTLALSPGKHCKSTSAALACTFSFALTPGRYRATVDTYDQPPSNGIIPPSAHVLSEANHVRTVVKSGKRSQLKLTLAGLPAQIAITAPSAVAGTAFAQPAAIDVDAADADGYTIVGPYAQPITLTDSDATGATAIATSGKDTPSGELLASSDVATLSYTGLAIVPATLTATVKGTSISAGASFAPTLQPIVIVTGDTQNPSFAGIDMTEYGTGKGTGGTIAASEAGWTSAPYSKTFTAAIATTCTHIATFVPANGTTFVVHDINNPSTGECTVTLTDGVGQTKTLTLAYTDYYDPELGPQTLVLPAGVTSVLIAADGAAGGSAGSASPGFGGELSGNFTFNPGDTLTITPGVAGSSGGVAGANGGGAAGYATAGSGGNASDVRLNGTALANRIIVAAGGGGAGNCISSSGGGAAGGSIGASGVSDHGFEGTGGSQSAGGPGGMQGGVSGSLGLGGAGGGCGVGGGGGGGGGYYGGGGGGSDNGVFLTGGGGGGGSSFISPTATNVRTNSSLNQSDGMIFISF